MGLFDKIESGIKKFAEEADKVVDQGRAKVDVMQLERQLDTAAKRLGYLEYDGLRGRSVDAGAKQAIVDEMVALEGQIAQLKADREAAKARQTPPQPATGDPSPPSAEAAPAQAAAEGAPAEASQVPSAEAPDTASREAPSDRPEA